MQIVRYAGEHRAGCLAVFDSNQAPFFADAERAEFADFLDNCTASSHYYVMLDAGDVVACGGFGHFDERLALTWGMVHRHGHRKGHGAQLLNYRLDTLREFHGPVTVHLDTSQHTEGFFTRHGFHTTAVQADGFAPGLHKVSMVRELD